MKILILLCVLNILISCSKDENMNSSVVSVAVEFSLIDQNGDDLLDSLTPNYFKREEMELYYLIDNKKIKATDFDPQIGKQNGIMLITETVPFRLRIFTYHHGDNGLISEVNGVKTGRSITYVELNGATTDTIKAEWGNGNNCFVNTKIWYNGELQTYPDTPFVITK